MKLFKILPTIAFTTLSIQATSMLPSTSNSNITENRSYGERHKMLTHIVVNELPKRFKLITVKKSTTIAEIKTILETKINELNQKFPEFQTSILIEQIINSNELNHESEIEYMIAYFEIFDKIDYFNNMSIKQFYINVKYID